MCDDFEQDHNSSFFYFSNLLEFFMFVLLDMSKVVLMLVFMLMLMLTLCF